jgi:hypothetical protein
MRKLVLIVCLRALFMPMYAQDAADPVPPPPLQPTVTIETGDTGGLSYGKKPDPKKTRRYYIAAEPEMWDYAPIISESMCGTPLPPSAAANHERVSKLRYVQYMDATFTTRMIPTPRLGILGPVLRGVVGETLAVTFLNRTGQPLSMHPHGVRYDKDSEGAYFPPNPGKGAAVGPGATFTYVWHLDESSGPMPSEPSSKAWLYHSHVTGEGEVNLGLVGSIIITDPKRARPDGTPKDVDREMAALYLIFDESGLDAEAREAYEYVNTASGIPTKTWAETMEFIEIHSRFAINGYTFGNLPGLEMNEDERVRWYLFALGSEQDFHTAHWHGMKVIEEGRRRTDVVELLPATMKVADMLADNPGTWLTHCHVAEHMLEGMFARYTVHPKDSEGVSRDPGLAFFGTSQAAQSLTIRRAEIISKDQIELAGSVTVFEAYSAFNQPITVEVAGQSQTFQPDRSGSAILEDSSLHIRNVNPFGVVYGGALEFEIRLKGKAWAEVVTKLKPLKKNSQRVHLRLGSASHNTSVLLTDSRPTQQLSSHNK